MSLRARLVASFTLLLLVGVSVLGFVVIRTSEAALIEPIDDRLAETMRRLPGAGRPFRGERGPIFSSTAAIVVVGATGDTAGIPAGFADDPLPLPDVEAYRSLNPSGIITIDAVESSLRYRAIGITLPDDGFVLVGESLAEVDATLSRQLRITVITGLVVLLLGAGLTWWTVSREMQPVADMVDTATAIAGGDLTRRVSVTSSSTEVGELGSALNVMLVQIERAVEVERESQATLKNFVADASHELRTPIAAVQGYAELYERKALEDPAAMDNAMQRIGKEGRRMQRLVEDMLLLARLDTEQPMASRVVDLVGIVRDVIADAAVIEPDRAIELVAPARAAVEGDAQRLTQVVSNLIGNVRAHTPPGSRAAVTIDEHGTDIVMKVRDHGPGIPDDHLAHVFDRFHRVDASRSRSSGGTGLGLAIVAAIVESHRGTVVAANHPDGGAVLEVHLPAHAT